MAGRLSPRVVPRFVLASGSPRRRQLLEKAGYEFDVVLPAVAEVSGAWLTIRETTASNAMRKATEIAQSAPAAVVLGADTLVALDGRVIGKPADLTSAAKILRRLSGRVHEVWTAVFICHPASGKAHSFQEERHRKLSGESRSARQGGCVRRAGSWRGNHQAHRRIVQQRRRFADG